MKPLVIDLHCDLLAHMLSHETPNPHSREGIGASFPALKDGNVKLQVMAIFTATEKGSARLAVRQSEIFKSFLTDFSDDCYLVDDLNSLDQIHTSNKLGMLAAIENASGLCEEDEELSLAFERLEQIISNTGRVLYIGLTHHLENRFGGGNSSNIGLKSDGEKLLDYLDGKRIAVDFSHTSDALAHDILNYIDSNKLDIRIIASHSNYRAVYEHNRNLPDDLAKEIINRDGLIGLNLLRAFVDPDDVETLYKHLNHGLKLGAKNAICFGADYFCTDDHPDRSRVPFYFPEHKDAGCYPQILKEVEEKVSADLVSGISNANVIRFLKELWESERRCAEPAEV